MNSRTDAATGEVGLALDAHAELGEGPTWHAAEGVVVWVDITRHLVPGLGAHRIDKLEPEHIEKLYGRMIRSGLAAGTVHHAHRTLRASLSEAVKRKHVDRSFDLVTPNMKSGYTRHAWATQDIPVQPYPLDIAKYKVKAVFQG